MNWAIVFGLGVAALVVMLALTLKGGFIILLGYLFLLAVLGFGLYMAYKWIFPSGWEEK